MLGRSRLFAVNATVHRFEGEDEPIKVGDDWLQNAQCEKIAITCNVMPRSVKSDSLLGANVERLNDDGTGLPYYSSVIQTAFKLEAHDIIKIEGRTFKQIARPLEDVIGRRSFSLGFLREI